MCMTKDKLEFSIQSSRRKFQIRNLLARKLFIAMKEQQLTVKEIEERIGVSEDKLVDTLSGESNLALEEIYKLEVFLKEELLPISIV